MNFFRKFFIGAGQPLLGIAAFYQQTSLWKYSLVPLAIVLGLYALIFWSGTCLNAYLAELIRQWVQQWPDSLHFFAWIFRQAAAFALFALLITFMALAIGPLYEIFGGVFFDRLIEKFTRRQFQNQLAQTSLKFDLLALKDSIIYNLITFFWMIAAFFALGALPVIGPVIAAFIIGYRLGVSYLALVGFRHRMSMPQLRWLARRHAAAVTGFGIMIYLLFSIPLTGIIFMPGIITGSVLLFYRLQLNDLR